MASVHHPGIEVVVRDDCGRCHGTGHSQAGVEAIPCRECGGTGKVDTQLLYPGEPFFLLRGKDRLAPGAVMAWSGMRSVQVGDPDDASARDAFDSAMNMLAWQQRNPGLTKTGD